MHYLRLAVFGTVCAVLTLLASRSLAADLVWEYPADYDLIDGWIAYYTDGTDAYIKTVAKSEVSTDGAEIVWSDIETALSLRHNVEYTLYLTAYNVAEESGPSNTVAHTRAGYLPPGDVVPDVIQVPGAPVTITIRIGD